MALDESLRSLVPHLHAWLTSEEDVVGLHVKHQPDGTFLAIAKGYDEAGGPIVCFGGGYGFFGALLTLDAALQGNRWRVDRPWQPKDG